MQNPHADNSALWQRCFPDLLTAQDPVLKRTMEKCRYFEFPANFQVSMPGSTCSDYVLVAGGSIRVQVVTEKGREVVLYHVSAGEGCVLTTSCLLSNTTFPAEGFTEGDTAIFALPAAEFDLALGQSATFRHFVFENFAQRLAKVIARIEQLCSPAIDRNLAAILIRLSDGSTRAFAATHQQIASELGTAREVVSRHLKRFETQGWIRLGRGSIEVVEPEQLRKLGRG